jgi:CCR4-NOT transcription complex subunit 7/8
MTDANSDPPPLEDRFFICNGKRIEIRDVWATNLEQEMDIIKGLTERYKYVAMDTEFPGVVARPIGSFPSTDYHYQTLRCNVDLLKIIQLGITFADENGELADDCPTWQFNFKFNLQEDMYAQDSIDLLTRSGIDFRNHEDKGIDVEVFGELMMSTGLVLMDDIKWISFHSAYDFGYLLKLLTNMPLPAGEPAFFDLLRTYFPCIYDVKYLMSACEPLKGGLNKLAEDLDVLRVGPMHQAGSDSLLTSATFFKLRKVFFDGRIDDKKYLGELYGLGGIM